MLEDAQKTQIEMLRKQQRQIFAERDELQVNYFWSNFCTFWITDIWNSKKSLLYIFLDYPCQERKIHQKDGQRAGRPDRVWWTTRLENCPTRQGPDLKIFITQITKKIFSSNIFKFLSRKPTVLMLSRLNKTRNKTLKLESSVRISYH